MRFGSNPDSKVGMKSFRLNVTVTLLHEVQTQVTILAKRIDEGWLVATTTTTTASATNTTSVTKTTMTTAKINQQQNYLSHLKFQVTCNKTQVPLSLASLRYFLACTSCPCPMEIYSHLKPIFLANAKISSEGSLPCQI